jgi:Transcriptional regulator PadR-like family/FtsX-like permease family
MSPAREDRDEVEALLPLPLATFHILLALCDDDRHGYAILQEVARRTGGELRLSAGTLYRSIQRMLEQGLLEERRERPAPEQDLAGVGIHGLLAFTVASRSQELGVRRALGARTSDILQLVVRHGLRLAALGTSLGLALAWAAGRSLEALLAGVSPQDLATSATAAFLALATALAGTLVPAWRAARVDPLKVIRVD